MAVEKVGKVGKVRSVARAPSAGRRFPLLEVGVESDEEKLESKITHAYPGTLPERIVIQWAVDEGLTFYVQKRIYGSYTMFMSTIVDLLILNYPGIPQPLVIRCMGQYWHLGTKGKRDDALRLRLEAGGYRVTDLWESDIYRAALDGRLNSYIDGAIRRPF